MVLYIYKITTNIYIYTHFWGLFLSSELCPITADFGRTHHNYAISVLIEADTYRFHVDMHGP